MPTQERLHIGHLVKSVFDESGMTVAEFARRIHCTRNNVYSIFERQDIGVEQLILISKALKHNFLDDLQLHNGLKTDLFPTQIVVNLDLESITPEKAKRLEALLKELTEEK